MTTLVGILVALVASILGGFVAQRFERRKATTKTAGDALVKQAEALGKANVKAAEDAAQLRLNDAQEKAKRDAKAEAAASNLRKYITARKPGGIVPPRKSS